MRVRDQRLRWIEKLISGNQQDVHRSNALIIPSESGNMAIAFTSIEEVVSAGEMRSLAFLPPSSAAFCRAATSLCPCSMPKRPAMGNRPTS